MNKITLSKLLSIVIVFLLPSCSNNSSVLPDTVEQKFLQIFDVGSMNEDLRLELYIPSNELDRNSKIRLEVTNKSDQFLLLNEDSHNIFVLHDGEWVTVDNLINIHGESVISPQGTPLLDHSLTAIKPGLDQFDLDVSEDSLLVRIAIVCEIIEDDVRTGRFVGAYIDVNISL